MTHTLPFRTRVLVAITDALKQITPANGYVSDLSDDTAPDALVPTRVFRGRAQFGDGDPLPMVSVLEAPEEAEDLIDEPFDADQEGGTWRLLIQGFCGNDPENPTDPAYVLLADVRRCLLAERKRKHPVSRHQSDPLGMGVVASGGSGNAVLAIKKVGKGIVRPPFVGEQTSSSVANFWMLLEIQIIEDGSRPYA